MKVGIIAPTNFLERYCITNIQYVLPRLLVEESRYRSFYTEKKKQGDTVILDCRVPDWRREPEDFNLVRRALELISPDIIVAPSHMFNAELSKETHENFLNALPEHRSKVIRCIEGTSEKDLKFGREAFQAIPSHMFRFLEALPTKALYLENHLNPRELEGREGILVTSLPVKLGLQGRLLSDFKPSPKSLTFHEEEDMYPKITLRNVEEIIEFYKEEET